MTENKKIGRKLFAHAAENGVFWMVILLGTLGFLSLFSAGRQAIRTGGGKVRAMAEGRSHKTPKGILPICSVENGCRQIALTFEAEGEGEGIHEILSLLDQHQVKASFFVTGAWARVHPDQVRGIAARGHDLGCLGRQERSSEAWSDQNQGGLKPSAFQQELAEARQCIGRITGREAELFRPEKGAFDDEQIVAVCGMGCYPVLWDVDSEDWKDYGAAVISAQVLEHPNLQAGSIIRFHCGAKYTPEALPEIMTELEAAGYELVPLSELVLQEQYRLDEDGRQETRQEKRQDRKPKERQEGK